jgi:hypothetical protein
VLAPAFGMADLLFQHRFHHVGHGPHALADLRVPGETAFKADIDIPVFIGGDPGGLLHVALADHRAGFHRGVDLVAGAVEEAGVDEHNTLAGSADAFLEVDGGAALLVHDAHLDGVGRHAESCLDAAVKISTAKATSSGPCIFGLTTYIEPVAELARRPLEPMSCRAISPVMNASMKPSGISLPSPSRMAGLVIRWPTLRTSMRERPFSVAALPSGVVYSMSP